MTIAQREQALLDELALFNDWTERYEYLIGLGKKLPPLPAEDRQEDHLIKGCQSQVWLTSHFQDGHMHYRADSDSVITKGLIALFIRLLDDQPPEDILASPLSAIEKTGLKDHLAPTRANALHLMAARMKQDALAHCTSAQ